MIGTLLRVSFINEVLPKNEPTYLVQKWQATSILTCLIGPRRRMIHLVYKGGAYSCGVKIADHKQTKDKIERGWASND